MDEVPPLNGAAKTSATSVAFAVFAETEAPRWKRPPSDAKSVCFAELHRCAVFCLLQLGREIFDTDMVIVDRTLTDICFDNTVVL